MSEKFRVTAKAIPRSIGGNQFIHFWSGGVQWSGDAATTFDLNAENLELVRKDEAKGLAVKIISVTPIQDESLAAKGVFDNPPQELGKSDEPTSTTTQAPEPTPTTTLPVQNPASTTTLPVVKAVAPWNK